MGRAAKMIERRNRKPPWPGYPDRWRVAGTDQHGEDFVAEYESEEQANAAATRLTRKGGNVTVSQWRWSSPRAGFIPASG